MVSAGLSVLGGLGAARPYFPHLVKGQWSKKEKLDPQVEMKSKSRKSDLIIEELPEDIKLLPWQSLQGIKDERLLVSVLSRVVAKEFNLDEMVTKF